jgi:2-oxoglutarate ferredoxin oxidoreductase subunit alpha
MTTLAPKTKDTLSTSGNVVNDFSMTIATKNGSGSQTSNLTLLRAFYKMGIPVSGKNIFPSNIQGLPTWYTIRVSKDNYLARSEESEIVVAMNFDTFGDDLQSVCSGGVFYYADNIKLAIRRDDITTYPIPAKKLARESNAPAKLRDYVANMAYVGVLAHMLGIDRDLLCAALEFHFSDKQQAVDLNMSVIDSAITWAADNLEKMDPFYVEPMDSNKKYILTDGNTAAALGSIYGGVQFTAWYPITPASSVAESLMKHIPDLRDDPETGERNYAIVQAEDELAAIGMAVGAGWGGLRSMTSTSGPGLSLMTEYLGLAYAAEVPLVLWDVQRVGPSTGLPTRTSQGDLSMVYFLGHGDTQSLILLPATANECFEFGWRAFDIAEHFQMPVFVLSDLDLGMNQWMTEPFEYPDEPMDRGKILWEDDFEKMTKTWGRYLDMDGDGIPYRTVIGNRHSSSAYFTRGTGHDEFSNYSEDPKTWEQNQARLTKKTENAPGYLPGPVEENIQGAKVGVLAYGSTDPAIREALDYLEEEGVKVNYMRVRAIPFTDDVQRFIEENNVVYVIEMNRDGQMHQILSIVYPGLAVKLVSLPKQDGLPLSSAWVRNALLGMEEK